MITEVFVIDGGCCFVWVATLEITAINTATTNIAAQVATAGRPTSVGMMFVIIAGSQTASAAVLMIMVPPAAMLVLLHNFGVYCDVVMTASE